MKDIFSHFVERFNKKDSNVPESESNIMEFENKFNIKLPADFRNFLLKYGSVWTPDVLDIIVEKELDFAEVQNFWDIESMTKDKKEEWTSQLDVDLIPFASDCMGNIYAFKADEIGEKKDKALVYFFDHDFDTVEAINESFTDLINEI